MTKLNEIFRQFSKEDKALFIQTLIDNYSEQFKKKNENVTFEIRFILRKNNFKEKSCFRYVLSCFQMHVLRERWPSMHIRWKHSKTQTHTHIHSHTNYDLKKLKKTRAST